MKLRRSLAAALALVLLVSSGGFAAAAKPSKSNKKRKAVQAMKKRTEESRFRFREPDAGAERHYRYDAAANPIDGVAKKKKPAAKPVTIEEASQGASGADADAL